MNIKKHNEQELAAWHHISHIELFRRINCMKQLGLRVLEYLYVLTKVRQAEITESDPGHDNFTNTEEEKQKRT